MEIYTINRMAGQFNDIVTVNDEIVFRFPKYAWIAEKSPATFRMLRALSDRVYLPIPVPTHMHCEFGSSILRYKFIPGRPLWREIVTSLDTRTLDRLATQLGTFLNSLHQVTPSIMPLHSETNLDSRQNLSEMYMNIEYKLFSYMSARGRTAIKHHFESFLDDSSNFHYTPVFRHGDPGPGNVLFDPESGSLSGIIDFDFAGFGDPAVDWSIALEPVLYGEEFVGRLARHFPVDEATLARAKFYRGTWILQEALRTFDAGEFEAFNREIASYQ